MSSWCICRLVFVGSTLLLFSQTGFLYEFFIPYKPYFGHPLAIFSKSDNLNRFIKNFISLHENSPRSFELHFQSKQIGVILEESYGILPSQIYFMEVQYIFGL